jgi:hypothetical protein
VPLPWIMPRGDLDYFLGVVNDIIRAAEPREETLFYIFPPWRVHGRRRRRHDRR